MPSTFPRTANVAFACEARWVESRCQFECSCDYGNTCQVSAARKAWQPTSTSPPSHKVTGLSFLGNDQSTSDAHISADHEATRGRTVVTTTCATFSSPICQRSATTAVAEHNVATVLSTHQVRIARVARTYQNIQAAWHRQQACLLSCTATCLLRAPRQLSVSLPVPLPLTFFSAATPFSFS